ncbi:MAG: tocopherol cyclase family protein [Candidatus Hermodarchaeota archaeon]
MGKRSRPNVFQGSLKKKFYFEGWYNKIVDSSANHIYAIIPTIALNKKEKTSHAFIQYLDGINASVEYFKYRLEDFENLSNKKYKIQIGKNYFSLERIHIDIDQQNHKIKGDLEYINPILWPKKFLQPGVMGWFSYVPFMETYHGMVSMNHEIRGTLTIDGEFINFDNGKGYIEKDWGKSFPSAWVWTQSNHFSNPNLSFMFSIAKIPFLGMKFNGFLSALWYEGDFYKFATYTSAKIKSLDILPDILHVIVEDKKYTLDFQVAKKGIGSGLLKAPKVGVMSGHIAESINSKIRLKLFDKRKEILIIDDLGINAGLEIKDPEVLKPKK